MGWGELEWKVGDVIFIRCSQGLLVRSRMGWGELEWKVGDVVTPPSNKTWGQLRYFISSFSKDMLPLIILQLLILP